MSDELRTPDVVTFTFETTIDYVVNLATGEVKRGEIGELAEHYGYVALFCEGEFAGEHHAGENAEPEPEDEALIDRAADLLDEAFENGTVVDPVQQISDWYDEVAKRYEDEVEPGVSDDSVLEAERDTLERVLAILNG